MLHSPRQSQGSALSIHPSMLHLPGEQATLLVSQHSAMSSRIHICHLVRTFPTCLSGFLRPTDITGNLFSWKWVKNYFSRASGKLGTSKWSISVVLIFRRQTDELKKGCLSFLRCSLFALTDMKTISKLSLLSYAYLHPLVSQPFKFFWIYWFIENRGRQTVTGKCTHLLPSLVFWVNLCHQIREEWKKSVNENAGRTTYMGKWRTCLLTCSSGWPLWHLIIIPWICGTSIEKPES